MYDIIMAEGMEPKPYSFSAFFTFNKIQPAVIKAKSIEEASKFRNKKALILLEDYKYDVGMMKPFSSGKAAFIIDLGRIISSYGMKRALEMGKMRRFLEICVKYGVPFVLASFAKGPESVRTSRELCHIAALLGLNTGQAKLALSRAGDYISPGGAAHENLHAP